MNNNDVFYMNLALQYSINAWGNTAPNPPVGAVIVQNNQVISTGYTQPTGADHAEIVALNQAGRATQNATLYVTLEPCNHCGNTPPCTQKILSAGIKRVVYGVSDPTFTAGGGGKNLIEHGIEVTTGILDQEISDGPLRSWLFKQKHGRPFITAKLAQTIDGKAAASDGSSKWITGDKARAHAHLWRSRVDAIVVGTNTIIADDPQLSARIADDVYYSYQPLKVILGRREINKSAQIYTKITNVIKPTEIMWHKNHDLLNLIKRISNMNHILIEGGPTVIGAFMNQGLIDEYHVYIAPAILGNGLDTINSAVNTSMVDIKRFNQVTASVLGDDFFLKISTEV